MGNDRRQYDYRGTKPSWRKWKKKLKRSTAKAARRDAKKDPENPPPRKTGGWAR